MPLAGTQRSLMKILEPHVVAFVRDKHVLMPALELPAPDSDLLHDVARAADVALATSGCGECTSMPERIEQ